MFYVVWLMTAVVKLEIEKMQILINESVIREGFGCKTRWTLSSSKLASIITFCYTKIALLSWRFKFISWKSIEQTTINQKQNNRTPHKFQPSFFFSCYLIFLNSHKSLDPKQPTKPCCLRFCRCWRTSVSSVW